MKSNIKTISILGLVGIFVFSIMFCCCFTNATAAEEPVPSCHQTTTHKTESSKSTDECQCVDSIVAVKQATVFKDSLVHVATIPSGQLFRDSVDLVSVESYQAPPFIHIVSSLYIKHSVLRI